MIYSYYICEIDKNESFVHSDISKCFDVDDPNIFTGSCYPNYFTTKRIIVIEMN